MLVVDIVDDFFVASGAPIPDVMKISLGAVGKLRDEWQGTEAAMDGGLAAY